MYGFHSLYLLSLYYMIPFPASIRPCVRHSVSSCNAISRNPPSLQWHYPSSSVLWGFSDCLQPVCLSPYVVRHTTYTLLIFIISDMGITGSPSVDTTSLCNMADLRPRGAVYILTRKKRPIHILPSVTSKTSAHQSELYFGAEVLSDPITSLSTLSTYCYQYTPKTRYRWFG